MKIYSLIFFFLCTNCIQVNAQKENFTWRFVAGVAISEPDIRGKSLVPEMRLGQDFKDIILAADASRLDSYFCAIEGSYLLSRWLELFGQVGHTTFYDDFPMVVNNGHFVKPGGNVYSDLQLVKDYFNYSLSPSIGFNLRVVDYRDFTLLIGTNALYNVTYYKLITGGRGRTGRGYKHGFLFDSHSIESFASVGLGYKKIRFFVDYRYFFQEYLDDATYNDGIAIKYENLTKFRFRLSYDLQWNSKEK